MDEGFRRKVKDFLSGTLDKKGTLEVLDEVRRSEVCRRYLEEQASAVASVRRVQQNDSIHENHGCQPVQGPINVPAEISRSVETDWGGLLESRKKRGLKRTVILGLTVLIFSAAASKLLKKEPVTIDPAVRAQVMSLEEGSPVVVAPVAGTLSLRPIAVGALLPAGNERVKISILGRTGLLFEREYAARDSGVELDPVALAGPEGSLKAVDALLPFPSAEELALVDGERYFLFVELPNGRQSTPISLDFRKD